MITRRSRAVLTLAIGAVVLLAVMTVPASAAARTSMRLSAAFKHSSVRVGTAATLTGRLSPRLGVKKLTVQRYYSRSWHTAGSFKTASSGRYSVKITIRVAGTYSYRVRYTGSARTKAATSPKRKLTAVKASTRVTGAFLAAAVHVDVPATMTGTLSPALAGRRIALQRYAAGRWIGASSATTDRAGRYTITITPNTAGDYTYRTLYAGSGDARPATSTNRALTVAATSAYNSSGLLRGTVNPTPPAGPANQVAVVDSSPISNYSFGGARIAVAVRNNTAAARTDVEVSAVARDSGGRLIATGTADRTAPTVVASGGTTLTDIYFDTDQPIPADATFTYSVSSAALTNDSYSVVTMQATEADYTGSAIIATATNQTVQKLSGPYRGQLFCFDPAGRLSGGHWDYASADGDTAPGGSLAFKVDAEGDTCDRFLFSASGYNF